MFGGLGKKIEHEAAEHYRNHLIQELAKDGTCSIPGVGYGVLDLKNGKLILDLDTTFLQQIRRTGQ